MTPASREAIIAMLYAQRNQIEATIILLEGSVPVKEVVPGCPGCGSDKFVKVPGKEVKVCKGCGVNY